MKKNVFYLLGIILLMVSCYPGEVDSTDDLDLVYTNYTDTYDFAGKGTYALPDKIVKFTGNLSDNELPEYVKEPYNSEILELIENNMTALGWSKEENPDNADLVLIPAVWTNTTVVYWYDYWCWYYYYYCGWGWSYPYYTSYTTGTLVMTMVTTSKEQSIDPYSVWTAALNGVASGSYDIKRITKGINQAFEQSPYLNTK